MAALRHTWLSGAGVHMNRRTTAQPRTQTAAHYYKLTPGIQNEKNSKDLFWIGCDFTNLFLYIKKTNTSNENETINNRWEIFKCRRRQHSNAKAAFGEKKLQNSLY